MTNKEEIQMLRKEVELLRKELELSRMTQPVIINYPQPYVPPTQPPLYPTWYGDTIITTTC